MFFVIPAAVDPDHLEFVVDASDQLIDCNSNVLLHFCFGFCGAEAQIFSLEQLSMSDSLTLRPFDNGLTPPEKNLRFLVEGWRNWILHDWLIRKIYHIYIFEYHD